MSLCSNSGLFLKVAGITAGMLNTVNEMLNFNGKKICFARQEQEERGEDFYLFDFNCVSLQAHLSCTFFLTPWLNHLDSTTESFILRDTEAAFCK